MREENPLMSTSVRTAVIPAAGLGTRFLPATKAMPKEDGNYKIFRNFMLNSGE